MHLLLVTLAQTAAPDRGFGRFMADPFVQGLVLGVAATALFAFVAVVIAGAVGRSRNGNGVAADGRAIAAPVAPVSRASSVPVSGPAADHNPLGSFAGVDPRHLAVIAAVATVALGQAGDVRIRRVTRVVPTALSAGSSRAESARMGA